MGGGESMNLFHRLTLEELNKVIHDLSFHKHQTNRNEIAHFCEHDGIRLRFTPAGTEWLAQTPCAFKPWSLTLKPMKKFTQQYTTTRKRNNNKKDTANKAALLEEIEHA